jgi:hypothetical protein
MILNRKGNHMENVYQHEMWLAMYGYLVAAAGSLVGLLFVATSIRFSAMKSNPDEILPARNNTLHLLNLLVEAVLILTPQPLSLLGAELVAINLFGLRLPVGTTLRYLRKNIKINHPRFPRKILATVVVGYLLGIAGGVGLIEHANWGLYLITASFVIILVRTVLTAWEIMCRGLTAQDRRD